MTTLATNHRNKLERVITDARAVAETGARAALESLAVHHHEFYKHMTPDEQKLRKRLRAHGQQLGDHYDSKKGTQAIDHLVNECAYEHWHRMLFARFLAENDLLIEPEMGVAISLAECEELAKEQRIDPWVLASRFAQQMLPQIFRPDDPLLQVTFAREHFLKLERLLESLEPEVFTASDAIGWVYQFWQSKKKDEVNRSGKKIGADELPAVTQLFTEPYMVNFLIHNTLGAWYAGKVFAANPDFARNAENEESLRNALALPGVTWDYLRFIKCDDGIWQPAAGTFDGWPKKTAELKVLDPCCGSGHFLVAVFLYLVALLMAEEKLSIKCACDAVLRDNIFGLEIDERCTQIAAFNVALTAWRLAGYHALPSLNLACSGLEPNTTKTTWMELAGGNERLERGMERLYGLFKEARILGSLINPRAQGGDLIEAEFHELQPLLITALAPSKNKKGNLENDDVELAVIAQGLAKAAELLAGQYTLVITNVPYLGRGNQDKLLKDYCASVYPKAKSDLATCFVERCMEFCDKNCSTALVSSQYWLFLATYKKMREKLLKESQWNFLVRLGTGAFETISGEVVNVALLQRTHATPSLNYNFIGLDLSGETSPGNKAAKIGKAPMIHLSQKAQLNNPNSKIVLQLLSNAPALEAVAIVSEGLHTGDYPRFGRKFWEITNIAGGWTLQQGGVTTEHYCSGMEHVLFWEEGNGELIEFVRERLGTEIVTQWIKGNQVWGKNGVAIGMMGNMKSSLYQGALFTHGISVIVPKLAAHYEAIRAFCESSDFCAEIRKLDQKVCAALDSVAKVPFDIVHWQKVAAEKYPNGLPKPHSDDPTQWLFNGHPKGAVQPLHVAVNRLLGYRWPRQTGSSFPDCPALGHDGLETFADDDGIVCIPSLRGEDAAVERLRELLVAAYGSDWSPAKERELVTAAQAQDLDDWLRNSFFEQHCQLFHHRPFIWHIWDGRKRDGFHALVNYHKLAEADGKGRQLLEKLTYGYLGDWVTLQKDGVKQGIGGADDRLAAALELEKRLKAILEGEPPSDIFVRWKQIEKQPIGWEPDINDGVRMNIRPFMADDIPGGKRGAGILRWKPNIKWDKDRGKDVASAPWFDLGLQYGGHPGDRINDHHLTCEEKRKAREAKEKKA